MSEAAPIWKCEMKDVNSLTVGQPFTLDCQGDIPVSWPAEGQAQVQFGKPEEQHSLVILQTLKQEPNAATYKVTSYKTGELGPQYIRVMMGQQGFETNNLKWAVQSILPKDKKPEPYPSFGPYGLAMPFWVWLLLLLVVGAIGALIWRFLRRRRQRRRMQELLDKHASVLSPHAHFHKELRQIKKAMDANRDIEETVVKLDQEFRLYLLRTFKIPAMEWSDREILRELRRQHGAVYTLAAKPIAKALRELGQLKASQQTNPKDLEQMFKLCRDTVDKVEAGK